MNKFFYINITLFILSASLYGQEPTRDLLGKHFRENRGVFETVSVEKTNALVSFEIDLGASSTKIDGKDEFDGLLIKAPKGVGGTDFIWYFNAPASWGSWYILPLSGEMPRGFDGWLPADKVYEHFDEDVGTNRFRAFQTLPGDCFQAGEEYVLWFRRDVPSGRSEKVRGVLSFADKQEDWKLEMCEEFLGLKPQTPERQVAALGSRGGKILLDKELFDSDYASGRIDAVFFSLRHTRNLRGGFFVTVEMEIPPCEAGPSFTQIAKKYGAPDFVRSSAEEARVLKHVGGATTDEEEVAAITYYYDYFGFEVLLDDQKQTVQRVVTHASDFSTLTPKDNGAYFAEIPTKNLMVFHVNKKEVGRLYGFLNGSEPPLVITAPPVDVYRRENETLEHQGDGNWCWKTYYQEGQLARVIPLKNHQLNGTAKGYYRDGKASFVVSYKNGRLDGDVFEYAGDGAVRKHVVYEDGKQIPKD